MREGILAQREVIALLRRAAETVLADAKIAVTDSDDWDEREVKSLPSAEAAVLSPDRAYTVVLSS